VGAVNDSLSSRLVSPLENAPCLDAGRHASSFRQKLLGEVCKGVADCPSPTSKRIEVPAFCHLDLRSDLCRVGRFGNGHGGRGWRVRTLLLSSRQRT
jgi:hypothetical protein